MMEGPMVELGMVVVMEWQGLGEENRGGRVGGTA